MTRTVFFSVFSVTRTTSPHVRYWMPEIDGQSCRIEWPYKEGGAKTQWMLGFISMEYFGINSSNS